MPDDLRIAIGDLRRRMEAGEDFTVIDTQKPQEWAQSNVMLPEAIRVRLDHFEEHLQRIPRNKPIVIYCT